MPEDSERRGAIVSNALAIIAQDQLAVLPKYEISSVALSFRDDALGLSALIGKVENEAQNAEAVKAQQALKRVSLDFEAARKAMKQPYIEKGRDIDRIIATELLDVDKELGRLSNLVTEFALAERRRVAEEAAAQARELARIEAEKQAELKRIADEQARVEREAREAREAAERAAKEATNKAQREAAAKAFAEAEAKRKESEAAAALAAATKAQVEEIAAAKTYAEGKPIQASREVGQVLKTDWEITVVNPYELAKYHPDCVTVTPKMGEIKSALNEGREIKGIKATKKMVASVRTGRNQVIEV